MTATNNSGPFVPPIEQIFDEAAAALPTQERVERPDLEGTVEDYGGLHTTVAHAATDAARYALYLEKRLAELGEKRVVEAYAFAESIDKADKEIESLRSRLAEHEGKK